MTWNYFMMQEPVSVLSEKYQSGSSILLEKIQVLSESYAAIRRIRGDGNCFFRSFMFSYLEHILESQDKAEVDRLTANIEQCKMTLQRLGYADIELCKKDLQNLGYADFTFKDIFAFFVEQLGNLLQGNESSISHEDLVQRSRDKSVSDYVVMFFRFVTSGEIRSRSEFFKPFILGLADTTVDENSVEPMGEESDNVQIIALSYALGVPIRVMHLDHRSFDAKGVSVNHYDFQRRSDSVKPLITLLYRPTPGHYDILYPKQSGKLLTILELLLFE
ncbi:hypothetical protein MKX01_013427 [Papaver californicum]|nr:hypothetical protein MKX01_013427 [Papaver californicum]